MNREEKRAYLSSYLDLKREIDSLTEEYHFWEEQAYTIPTTNLNNFGIHGTGRKEPLTTHFDICIQLEEKIKEVEQKLKEILAVIDSLQNKDQQSEADQRSVLRYRYVNGLYFHEIAKKMGCTLENVYVLHRNGLNSLDI